MGERDGKNNLYNRHQNTRAKAKKERAKRFRLDEEESPESPSCHSDGDDYAGGAGTIAGLKSFGVFHILKNGDCFEAKLDGAFPKNLINQLAVGDKVALDKDNAIVSALNRTSFLARLRGDSTRHSRRGFSEHVIAANVDAAVIVATTKEPDFQPRLIDRYLILCEYGNVEPIICLNKSDLTDERDAALEWYRKMGISVIETSAIKNTGIQELIDAIHGKTVVFAGNSGVGKSSLINKINPRAAIKTQAVSGKGRQGRHTTTGSNLYMLDKETCLIDTPGIRSLGLSGVNGCDIKWYFKDFNKYEGLCKYKDCLHDIEPECAVKKAVSDDKISPERYRSYIRILHDRN
ncbi:MAG: ribosome small subunit-dependent GTPase A [Treponema sp.]|jgi:ribosome biogenesis GTPase|nr:ribosome small subunit-dependent GTPase A [Treponema sp.]